MPFAIGLLNFDSGMTAVAIYAIVWGIVFTESGLLVGFFLPGDTMLVAAGVAASQGHANIAVLCIGTAVAAIVGDSVGYAIGLRAGRPMLRRRDGRVLNQHNLRRATAFYDRFGSATIVVARFVPMVRTFAPLIAGVTEMKYRKFVAWNVIGGLLWGAGVPLLGYVVGDIPGLDKISLAAAGVMVVLSFVYAGVHFWLAGRHAKTGVLEEQVELLAED